MWIAGERRRYNVEDRSRGGRSPKVKAPQRCFTILSKARRGPIPRPFRGAQERMPSAETLRFRRVSGVYPVSVRWGPGVVRMWV